MPATGGLGVRLVSAVDVGCDTSDDGAVRRRKRGTDFRVALAVRQGNDANSVLANDGERAYPILVAFEQLLHQLRDSGKPG